MTETTNNSSSEKQTKKKKSNSNSLSALTTSDYDESLKNTEFVDSKFSCEKMPDSCESHSHVLKKSGSDDSLEKKILGKFVRTYTKKTKAQEFLDEIPSDYRHWVYPAAGYERNKEDPFHQTLYIRDIPCSEGNPEDFRKNPEVFASGDIVIVNMDTDAPNNVGWLCQVSIPHNDEGYVSVFDEFGFLWEFHSPEIINVTAEISRYEEYKKKNKLNIV